MVLRRNWTLVNASNGVPCVEPSEATVSANSAITANSRSGLTLILDEDFAHEELAIRVMKGQIGHIV